MNLVTETEKRLKAAKSERLQIKKMNKSIPSQLNHEIKYFTKILDYIFEVEHKSIRYKIL